MKIISIRVRRLALLYLASCFVLPALAQETIPPELMSAFYGRVGHPIPNVELPPQIPAPAGKLTLYADFAANSDRGVPLFLVNRTDQPITFNSQDGDIYVKLEHLLPSGKWERAQSHLASWCGNSYGGVVLQPGQFFQSYGYLPKDGVRSRVRYAKSLDAVLTSNEGDGYVLEKDIQAAKVDSLSKTAPSRISELLDPTLRVAPSDVRPPAERVAAMRLLQVYGANYYYQQCAREWAHKVEANTASTPGELQAADIIKKIIEGSWPTEQNSKALLTRCVEALQKQDTHQTEFGMPGQQPALVWSTVADLAQWELGGNRFRSQNLSDSFDLWKIVTGMMDDAINSRDEVIVRSAAAISAVGPLSDELLPNAFYEKHLWSKDRYVQKVCANTLSRRGQHQQLVSIGWKLPPAGQVVVLEALAYPHAELNGPDGAPQAPNFQGNEEKFWTHCIGSSPIESAYVLYKNNDYGSRTFTMIVHDAVHDFFLKEAEQSDATTHDFETSGEGFKWRMAIEFLASYQRDEDTPLFQHLLNYRGYDKQNVGRQDPKNPHAMKDYIEHHYLVRVAAKEALLKRGASPEHDVVAMVDTTP